MGSEEAVVHAVTDWPCCEALVTNMNPSSRTTPDSSSAGIFSDGVLDAADISTFVTGLLTGADCP